MTYGMTREEGLELVRTRLQNPNLINHSLAAEVVLRAMAEQLGEDPEKWGLAGLLHDLDSETQPELATHTSETVAILKEKGVNPEIVEAIRLHNLTARSIGRAPIPLPQHQSCEIVLPPQGKVQQRPDLHRLPTLQ